MLTASVDRFRADGARFLLKSAAKSAHSKSRASRASSAGAATTKKVAVEVAASHAKSRLMTHLIQD